MARSLAEAAASWACKFAIASPEGLPVRRRISSTSFAEPIPEAQADCDQRPGRGGARAPSAVYTDVWTSMGQESESEPAAQGLRRLPGQREADGARARGACFMHCLPAHRGEEVTDEVIDGPQSVVVQQAANRMHVQKGMLAWLLGSQK